MLISHEFSLLLLVLLGATVLIRVLTYLLVSRLHTDLRSQSRPLYLHQDCRTCGRNRHEIAAAVDRYEDRHGQCSPHLRESLPEFYAEHIIGPEGRSPQAREKDFL